MGKVLGAVIQTVATVAGMAIGAAVGGPIGAAIGAGLGAKFGSVTVGLLGLGPNLPKPDTTELSIKTSRPPRVSHTGIGRLYGAYVLFETASDGTAVDVYAVHDGPAQIQAFYLGDEVVTRAGNTVNEGADGRYRDAAVSLYATTGGAVGSAFAAIVSLLPGIWTNNHRGDGVVMLAQTAKSVKAKNYQETYPSGTVPVPSVVAKWNVYPDPAAADPTNEALWTWTENSVRHLLWYKLKFEGVDYATKIAPTLQYWIDAAADCDAAMPLKAGGTEPRYRACVPFKHTDPFKDVSSALLATFDGWIAPRADGALVVYSGRYTAPDPADLIGPDEIVSYTWEGAGVDDDTAVNEIVCSYVSAAHDYNTVECDAWRNEADISARGRILSQPLEASVPSHAQARRLAKRLEARVMAPKRGTVITNVRGRKIRGKRYIPLRIEEAGAVFYDGPVEITALTRNMSTGGVTFSWVAADPNVDAWNPATEEGEPAADGPRVAPLPLPAPVINTVAVNTEDDSGSGVTGARLIVDVGGPDREDLTWFVRWKVTGSSAWAEREYADTDPGTPVVLVTEFVPFNASVDVEVAYQVGDGRVAAWSATSVVDTGAGSLIYLPGGNLLSSPEAFDASPWASDGVAPTITPNAANGPYSAAGADFIHFDRTGGSFSRRYQNATVVNGLSYEFGVWLKASTPGKSVLLRADTTSGPVLTLTTEWQRYTVTATATSTTMKVGLMVWDTVTDSPVAADVFAFGAQLRQP